MTSMKYRAKATSDFEKTVQKIEGTMLEDARKIYTGKVIKEAYNPKNVGEIKDANGIGRITGPCGDTIRIYLKVENEKIIDSKFLTDGCGATIACGSVITELVKGKKIEEALRIESDELISIFGGLPEDNLHCPVLAVNTLRTAINDYKSRVGWR